MIVNSSNLVLAQMGALGADNPLIGWRNVVTPSTIIADTEEENYPASNLANPALYLRWKGEDTSEQYLTITTNRLGALDYVAVVGHNFSSAQIPISIEGYAGGSSPGWIEIVQEAMLPNDGPAVFRFEPDSYSDIRIKLKSGSAVPFASVVYCGRLLVVERKIYQDLTPIVHGKKSTAITGRSESGNVLARIVTNEKTEASTTFRLLSPDWYRTNFHPFVLGTKSAPFFFVWRPQSYPYECGFVWHMSDPRPFNAQPHGLVEVELQMQGIVSPAMPWASEARGAPTPIVLPDLPDGYVFYVDLDGAYLIDFSGNYLIGPA